MFFGHNNINFISNNFSISIIIYKPLASTHNKKKRCSSQQNSAVAGFLGSLGASGWTSVMGTSGAAMIGFGALAGGVGAELTGGNFWQGAITGGIVAGLNHAMHSGDMEPDNGYDENGKKISDIGGDKTDYILRKIQFGGEDAYAVLASTDVKHTYGPYGNHEGYGYRMHHQLQSPALYDPSFDIMSNYVGGAAVGRFISGAKFMYSTKVGGQFSLGYLDKPTKFMIRFEKHSLPKIGGGRGYPVHFNIEKMGSFNKHIFPNIKDWGKYKVR